MEPAKVGCDAEAPSASAAIAAKRITFLDPVNGAFDIAGFS
jgi:hypothetical protein